MGLQGGAPGKLPSRFFIHLLILTISSVTAILLETFIYAQEKEKSYAYAQAELKEAELKFLKMQNATKFDNGMSIVQLEERFEMLAADGGRTRTTSLEGHLHLNDK